MKKNILLLFAFALLLLCGCSDAGDNTPVVTPETSAETTVPEPALKMNGDTYVITEEKYLEGVLEIYNNPDKYIGKRVEFEGEYIAEIYMDEMYYQVYRYVATTESHTDNDGDIHTHKASYQPVGFRINYDGNKPMDKVFVKVTGVIDTYDVDGESQIIINADTLKKSEIPGKVYLTY